MLGWKLRFCRRSRNYTRCLIYNSTLFFSPLETPDLNQERMPLQITHKIEVSSIQEITNERINICGSVSINEEKTESYQQP